MALISSCCYTISWLIISHFFYPNFADDYLQFEMTRLRQSGAAEAVMQQKLKMLEDYKTMSANPLMNALLTFTEPIPVGIVVALISAAVLRKKTVKP